MDKAYSFSKAQRLRRPDQFGHVMSSGMSDVRDAIVVRATHNSHNHDEACRLGLVVSKKVGNAVTRNRVKRQLREAFRTQACHQFRNLDLVVIARHSAAHQDQRQLASTFIKSLTALERRLRTHPQA